MPKVIFPRFKTSLRVARQAAARKHGERLARAIARLEPTQRDLVADIVARFDPRPNGLAARGDCTPEPPPDPPGADDPKPDP